MTAPRRRVGLVSGVLAVVLPAAAHGASGTTGEPRRHGPSRVSAVLGVAANNIDVAVDGRRTQTQEDEFSFALDGGYARRVAGPLFLGALLRADYFRDRWSVAVGETRFRFDLRAGPELRLALFPSSPNAPELGLSLGGGPTLAAFLAEDHPIVEESYGLGTGWNAGGRLFGTFLGQKGRGPYVGLDFTVFGFEIPRRASVPGDPSLSFQSQYRFFGEELFLLVGYAFGF